MNIYKKIRYVLWEIKQAYYRAFYTIDEPMFEYPDEFTVILLQNKIDLILESRGLEIKEQHTLEQISFGLGSYLEMVSGVYTKKDKEFKRLDKEFKKGWKLLGDNMLDIFNQ